MAYARVARFTGVDADDVGTLVGEVEASEGPPPGVPSSAVKLLVDENAGTVIFISFFDSEEDLRTGDAALREFSPPVDLGGPPQVDLCEIKVEKQA